MINLRSKRSLLAIIIVWLSVSIVQGAITDGDWEQLRDAVRQGDTRKVTQLINSGVNINHQDKAGWTVLHWWNFSYNFSDKKFLETLRLLIKCRVNVNAVDTRGRTALMILLVPGDDQSPSPQLEAIKILIDAGSDLRLKNEWGENVISIGLTSNFNKIRAYFIKLDKASLKE